MPKWLHAMAQNKIHVMPNVMPLNLSFSPR